MASGGSVSTAAAPLGTALWEQRAVAVHRRITGPGVTPKITAGQAAELPRRALRVAGAAGGQQGEAGVSPLRSSGKGADRAARKPAPSAPPER